MRPASLRQAVNKVRPIQGQTTRHARKGPQTTLFLAHYYGNKILCLRKFRHVVTEIFLRSNAKVARITTRFFFRSNGFLATSPKA